MPLRHEGLINGPDGETRTLNHLLLREPRLPELRHVRLQSRCRESDPVLPPYQEGDLPMIYNGEVRVGGLEPPGGM